MGNDIVIITGTLAALAAAAFLADRLLLWMERRAWIYWRKRKGLSAIGADFMQGTSPQAQANKKAMEQERVRKNVRPAEEPPFSVDLDAGVVRLRLTEHRDGGGGEDGSGRGGGGREESSGGTARAEINTRSGRGGRPGTDH
ncbi:hypothetical protein ACFYYR_09945 [Streptomyces sp. NPDC001922]|uniref:hypothetical protein n=1 Tax=Streptomyces sp. NPDC001922 TaxID=3364624 RepID=UPI003687FED2